MYRPRLRRNALPWSNVTDRGAAACWPRRWKPASNISPPGPPALFISRATSLASRRFCERPQSPEIGLTPSRCCRWYQSPNLIRGKSKTPSGATLSSLASARKGKASSTLYASRPAWTARFADESNWSCLNCHLMCAWTILLPCPEDCYEHLDGIIRGSAGCMDRWFYRVPCCRRPDSPVVALRRDFVDSALCPGKAHSLRRGRDNRFPQMVRKLFRAIQ